MIRTAVVLLVTLWSAAGCDPAAAPAAGVEVTDSAGVEIVRVPGGDRPLEWRFVERWRVDGRVDRDDGGFGTLARAHVRADGLGRFWIVDPTARRLLVLDSSGALVRTVGRAGEGPGELVLPHNLSAHPDGSASVYDFRRRALIRFDEDGGFAGEERPEILYQGPHLQEDSTGLWFTEIRRLEDGAVRRSLARHRPDGVRALTWIDTPAAEPVAVPGCPVRVPSFPLFGPDLRWALGDGVVAVADGVGYRIDLYRDTTLVRSLRRDLPERPVTREMAVRELGDGFTIRLPSGPCTAPAEEMADARGWADRLPAVAGLAWGPDGTLWVERGHVRGEPAPIDLFDSGGAYLGTLPPGSPLPAAFLGSDLLVAVETDELDVPTVVAYEVRRDEG